MIHLIYKYYKTCINTILQDSSARTPGTLLTEPMMPTYLASAKTGGGVIDIKQKSSSEAPIARLESLEESGTEGSTRETKPSSVHKQRSSDV